MYEGLEEAVRSGDVLAGKYRVDRVLGAGGMGVVVAATHLQLDQVVALKFVHTEAMHNPEIIGRFEREARAAVRLKSEHAARIIDVGRLASGSPYIVMEYLEGQDLAQVLEQQRSLPVSLASDYIIQACDAIAEAHSLGIVHRDLKPGNLFLARASHGQQVIKVLDFGISKTQGPTGEANLTRTQAVMGSPGYMSPEQMRSTKNVDGRTDIWSLGIILYELVAGRTPFQADTFSALCVKIAVDPHPAVLALPAKLPPGFEAVVNRALEKDPAMRYRSAAELALALVPYAGASARERAQRLISASRIAMPSAAHQVILGPHASTIEAASGQALLNTRRLHGGSRALAIAGTGIAAAAVIGFVVSVTRSSGGGEGRDNRDSRVDPRGQRRELPHAVGQPDPIEPHAPLDAGASSSIPVAPSPSASVPSQAAPPAPPPAGRPDAAEPAPATPVPAKSRSRPATLDPYSSPD